VVEIDWLDAILLSVIYYSMVEVSLWGIVSPIVSDFEKSDLKRAGVFLVIGAACTILFKLLN